MLHARATRDAPPHMPFPNSKFRKFSVVLLVFSEVASGRGVASAIAGEDLFPFTFI
jgi:hypothetical protein